jgi:hypothetical protein
MNQLVGELIFYLKTKEALTYFLHRIDSALMDLSTAPELSRLNAYFTMKEMAMISSTVKNITDFQGLKEELSRAEVFTIKLAFRPSAFFENILIDTVIKSTPQACVVQILTDRHIMGGAVVDFKGKYRDYSLKSAVEEWKAKHA